MCAEYEIARLYSNHNGTLPNFGSPQRRKKLSNDMKNEISAFIKTRPRMESRLL